MKAEFQINMTIDETVGTKAICELIKEKVCSSIHYYPNEGWSVSLYPGTGFSMNEQCFRVWGFDGYYATIPAGAIVDMEIRQGR